LVIDGVIREVVETAQAGAFVEPGNVDHLVLKIYDLFENKEKLPDYSRNGQRYIRENFNREQFSKALMEIMEKL
jgi:glycosyltransferase involved in cell wall biosynthesis